MGTGTKIILGTAALLLSLISVGLFAYFKSLFKKYNEHPVEEIEKKIKTSIILMISVLGLMLILTLIAILLSK